MFVLRQLKSVRREDQDGSDYVITAWLSSLNWYKIDIIVEIDCTMTYNRHDRKHFEEFKFIVYFHLRLLYGFVFKENSNRRTSEFC